MMIENKETLICLGVSRAAPALLYRPRILSQGGNPTTIVCTLQENLVNSNVLTGFCFGSGTGALTYLSLDADKAKKLVQKQATGPDEFADEQEFQMSLPELIRRKGGQNIIDQFLHYIQFAEKTTDKSKKKSYNYLMSLINPFSLEVKARYPSAIQSVVVEGKNLPPALMRMSPIRALS